MAFKFFLFQPFTVVAVFGGTDEVALNNFVVEMENEQSGCIVMYLFVTVCVMCNVRD